MDLDPRPVLFFLPLNDDNVDGVGALAGEAEIVFVTLTRVAKIGSSLKNKIKFQIRL